MSTVTRIRQQPTSRDNWTVVFAAIDGFGEARKPGTCAGAENLKERYDGELTNVFVDLRDDGTVTIRFTERLTGDRLMWNIRDRGLATWVLQFDNGNKPDYNVSVLLERRTAKVTITSKSREIANAERRDLDEMVRTGQHTPKARKSGSYGQRGRRPVLQIAA